MVHVPGKQMYTSDTLSRLQRKQPDSKPEESLIPDQEMSAFVCGIVDALPMSDIKLTLSEPGFEKLAQTGGADSAPPSLTPLPCIRTKPNLVWANTII